MFKAGIICFPSSNIFSANIQLLVVAGGGGGGGGGSTYANGGGGGAGGFIYQSLYTINAYTTYTVTVGAGGAGGASDYTNCTGTNGGNSIFNDQTAIGGGGAAGWSGVAPTSGGSGAGGPSYTTMGSSSGTSGTSGQGNSGGSGNGPSFTGSAASAGGGGGALTSGSNYAALGVGGAGGLGITNSITGTANIYSSGGGGGGPVTGGYSTNGGSGGSGNVNGSKATANTGGGGGGAGAGASGGGTSGGSGGSGTVIISFLTSSVYSYIATGTYTTSTVGLNTVLQWTSGSGTFMILSTPYLHSYSLVTDHTQAGTTDTNNFKVNVSLTLNSLKTVANGGSVQNTTTYNGQTVPADVVFSSNSTYTSLMNWGVESYDPVNGILVAHVLLNTLHHSSNDTFYMGIGNSANTTYQGGAVGAFLDSNVVTYLPLPNGSTLSALDYSSNGNNGNILGGVGATAGRIDGAASFDGSSGYISFGNNLNMVGTTGSISFWLPNKGTNKTAYLYARNPNVDQYADLGIVYVGGNLVVCVATNASTNWAQVVTSYSSVNNGDFFVFTFNASNLCTCYQNGISIWSYTFPYSFNNNESGAISTIARGGSYNNYYFDGIMDDFMYRSDNPSTSWITARYNNDKVSSTFLTTNLLY